MDLYNKFDFCTELKSLLEAHKNHGRSGKIFENLGALSTYNNLWALRVLSLDKKPKSTLEIGLAFGASCLALAATHRDLGHTPNHQHVSVDPYQSTVWDDSGKLIIEKAKLDDYVDVRENFSYIILPQLISEGRMGTFDLIYVDGSHLFEDVFIDFYYSNILLSEQGLILFDDSYNQQIRKVLDFIDNNFYQSYQKVNLSSLYSGNKKLKYDLAVKLKKNQLTVYRKIGETTRHWNAEFKNF